MRVNKVRYCKHCGSEVKNLTPNKMYCNPTCTPTYRKLHQEKRYVFTDYKRIIVDENGYILNDSGISSSVDDPHTHTSLILQTYIEHYGYEHAKIELGIDDYYMSRHL